MSKNKRYFWLKLKDDFFNQKEIKMLRRIAGGDTYTIIYLKMLLLSLKNDGKIYFDGIADNFVEEIALDIDEEIENTQITFNYLQQKGMIQFDSDVELDMVNIASMIGSETESARRVRKHRNKKALQSNNDVTDQKHLGNTEIEIEIEIEKELEIKTEREEEGEGKPSAAAVIQDYFGIKSISPNVYADLEFYIGQYDEPDAIINRCIEILRVRNVRNWKYMKKILDEWRREGLKTLAEVDEYEAANKAKVQSMKKGNQPNAYSENADLIEERRKQREADMLSDHMPFG